MRLAGPGRSTTLVVNPSAYRADSRPDPGAPPRTCVPYRIWSSIRPPTGPIRDQTHARHPNGVPAPQPLRTRLHRHVWSSIRPLPGPIHDRTRVPHPAPARRTDSGRPSARQPGPFATRPTPACPTSGDRSKPATDVQRRIRQLRRRLSKRAVRRRASCSALDRSGRHSRRPDRSRAAATRVGPWRGHRCRS